jgi:hypothetical protein
MHSNLDALELNVDWQLQEGLEEGEKNSLILIKIRNTSTLVPLP